MSNDIYKTRETSIATYLIGKGAKFIKLEKFSDTSWWMVFEDSELCYKLEKEFLVIKGNLLKGMQNE